jgi:ribosome biogenesis protein MAK21
MSKTIKHDTMAFMKSIGLGDGKSNTNIERKENTKSLDSKSKGKNDKSKQSVDSKNNNNNNKFNTKSANSKPTSTKENANKPLPTPRVIESGKFVAASNKAAVADKTNNKNKEHNKISNEVSIATSNMWWNEKHESSAPLINLNGEMSWYEVDTSMDNFNSTQYKLPKHVLDQIHSRIDILYKEEVSNYHRSKKLNAVNSSDQQWLDGIIKSGTLSDKIAALTLRVSESPVHELETLDLLVAMANKKEQRISKLALESLKDLLINNLLPSNRKLTPLSNKPLGHPEMTIKLLLLFKYENELILRIIQIINALEYGLQSNLEYYKKYCMEIVFDWLNQKPEQEARLLRILVNKMGDPNNKILLKCNEVLRKLCKNHPGMVPIVITEIWQLIGRENIQPRVMYSGVIYLSQIRLNDGNDEINSNIALKLIEYYIHIFEKTLDMQQSSSHGHESKKKSKSSNSNHNNEYSSKLLSIVLIGINRIFPYLKDKSALIKHIDVLFKIVHSANFSSLTQSLTLLSHIIFDNDSNKTAKKTNNKSNNDNNENNHSIDKSLIDRFYRSLYSTLLISQVLIHYMT